MGITGQKNLLFEVSNLEYPKVSVVIPVYNAEEYLNRCIASLTSQTYQNMEYLFVDDGSNDCSPALLEAAAKSDDRILFFSQKNAGPSAARNLGMDHATGKYLLFCDSDDTVSPTWCERLVRAIQEHPTSWIVCGIQTIDETGHELYVTQPPSPQQLLEKSAYFSLFKRDIQALFIIRFSISNCFVKPISVLMNPENGGKMSSSALNISCKPTILL